jgi:hypothetical protein
LRKSIYKQVALQILLALENKAMPRIVPTVDGCLENATTMRTQGESIPEQSYLDMAFMLIFNPEADPNDLLLKAQELEESRFIG